MPRARKLGALSPARGNSAGTAGIVTGVSIATGTVTTAGTVSMDGGLVGVSGGTTAAGPGVTITGGISGYGVLVGGAAVGVAGQTGSGSGHRGATGSAG